MTRLSACDIQHIAGELETYDRALKLAIGLSLRGLACRAAGCSEPEAMERIARHRICAVPVTSGQGIIARFSATLCAIAGHLGFTARVSRHPDLRGLAEAYEVKDDIIISADDCSFFAVNTITRRVVDNAWATGRGFVAGLAQMAGGLQAAPVLVIGCGPVGGHAALTAAQLGAKVTLFDKEAARCHHFAREHDRQQFCVTEDLGSALKNHELIVEATPAPDTIDVETIDSSTMIAAPGVPCGVTPEGRQRLGRRLLWDPLEIGVATMLVEAIAGT